MKKFRSLGAAILVFALVSILTAGCNSASKHEKIDVSELTSVSQTAEGDATQGTKESGTYGETASKAVSENSSDKTKAETQADTEAEGAERESVTNGEAKTQAAVQTGAEKPVQTQGSLPSQTASPKPTTPSHEAAKPQTTSPAPATPSAPPQTAAQPAQTQPSAAKPTSSPSPTQPPAQTPAQTQAAPAVSSVTLPITVSDNADAAAESIILKLVNGGMSEFDKVKAIHDYIVMNVEYPAYIDMGNRSLFTAEGALINRLAVCQGYAEAFSLLCFKAGIQTEMVYGTADNGEEIESHAWNLVRVDGVWYQLDVTWDDPVSVNSSGSSNLRYNYFLVPDSVMNRNHMADSYTGKHSCTDSRYLEYGEKQTLEIIIKQKFGDIKYDIVSNEAEVKKAAAANFAAGVKKYLIVYNMGQNVDESTAAAASAALSDICAWIPQATERYSSISFETMYQYGIKYIMVSADIK
ncbi:MAG: hypothetical protein NC223_04300 [Butyrivibrio sp.]|nr:hypothetical protein [Butyrivibrio sp.]